MSRKLLYFDLITKELFALCMPFQDGKWGSIVAIYNRNYIIELFKIWFAHNYSDYNFIF